MAQDPFASGKEVRQNQVAFNKLNDYVIGYFVGSKDITTDRGITKLYEVKGAEGAFHNAVTTTDENGNKLVTVDKDSTKIEPGDFYTIWGGKDSIDDLFKKVKLGQKLGLRFEEAIPSKKKGNSPFKVFKTVMWDEYDQSNPMDDAVDSVNVPGVDF